MKKIVKVVATIVMLGAMCFLCGEWPEDTSLKKVVTHDGAAFATMLVCGLYLGREYKKESKK